MKIFKRNINLGRKVPVIDTPDLRNKCVTTDKLADVSVTTSKIADGAITREKIADGAITNLDNVVQQVTDALEDINKSEQQIQQNEVGRNNTWTSWFSDVLPTGVRYLWNAFFSTAQTEVSRAITDAQDTADHPTYVGEDNYVYAWNKQIHSYNKTSIYVRGEGFHVSKIFASISDMEAYTGTDLEEGDFVLIQSTPDDPDNAKLYTYSGTQGIYNYLVDMSGAMGFTGKTPQFSIGSIITIEPTEQASASLSPDGTDSDGNPKYKLNLALPKGETGDACWEKGTGDNSAKLKGTANVVKAAKSVAFGDYNTIQNSAKETIVAGRMNFIAASKGAAFGNVNSINANNGFAAGGFNKVSGANAYAEGNGNYVYGKAAHMEGNSILQITLTGAANTTTYTIAETLPSFFIGLPVYYAVSPKDNDGVAIFTQALITAIDVENNTITLDSTLSASVALENATARVLCSTTQLKSSHVEGSHNFIILNDALTENPLLDTIINDLFNTEKEARLQGGHIEGYGNVIAGKYAHAEGAFNLVTGNLAHAEGQRNKVFYQYAHAEGFNNIADSNSAHVEGNSNYARGPQAHAEGYSTKTLTSRAHAEGYGTIAGDNDGYANHAEGYGTIASGNCGNHAEGFATMVSGSVGAHAEGYGGYIVHLTGAENVTTYSVDKAPLDNWLNSYVMNNSMVKNSIRKIIAIDKINNTITVDETFGAEVTPNKTYRVISQLSLGSATHVEGFINIAKGNASHAEGYNTYSPGLCSHAEGCRTVALGKRSHVQGENNIAQGDYSHSEGYGNKAFGKSSHAGGDGSLIVNLTGAAKATTYSVDVTPTVEWVGCLIKTTIDNDINVHFSITEIDATNKTITVNETLDGTNALSNAPYSIALGGAIADYSFAHGKGVQAGTEAGAVFGKFNVPRSNALFAIGNGSSYTSQHDAFYVDVDGNVYIAGNIVSAQITQLTNKITELENRIAALEGKS